MSAASNDTSLVTEAPTNELAGVDLDLAPGQWWSVDGRLRLSVVRSYLPNSAGWVWVEGWSHDTGGEPEWSRVPVRVEALPQLAAGGDRP